MVVWYVLELLKERDTYTTVSFISPHSSVILQANLELPPSLPFQHIRQGLTMPSYLRFALAFTSRYNFSH